MSATTQATRNTITLKGSTDIITEFFFYSINSILYQRGIYPPESFSQVKKYNLSILVSTDQGLKEYLQKVTDQVNQWLLQKAVQKLVLVITGTDTKQVLERWCFDIETDKTVTGTTVKTKPEKEIRDEIRAIIRQVTASVTFLPLLAEPCTFDLLVYTDSSIDTPKLWEESDPRYIINSEEVRLRSFTTKIHKIDTMVAYKSVTAN